MPRSVTRTEARASPAPALSTFAVLSFSQRTADIGDPALQYGRYGCRKIAAPLRRAGWLVSDKRVARIWRREGLKAPVGQPKCGRQLVVGGPMERRAAD